MTLMINNEIIPVSIKEAKRFCHRWHYSNIFPPHCMIALGFYDEQGLAGVAIWGWGVRPKHTIKKLFPSLTTTDYWELNRLCCREDKPKNTESWFLSRCMRWLKEHQPQKKVLITWADGIRGKPGYVYQASNWLYGGFITTEIYLTTDDEPVHPRLLITRFKTRKMKYCGELGLHKVRGRQFIYLKFLCGNAERKKLLRESKVKWSREYPKSEDLSWVIITAGEVSRATRDAPSIQRAGRFRQPAPDLFVAIKGEYE
jgi:hypothetical protein